MTKAQAGSSRARSAGKAGSVMGERSSSEDVQVIGDDRALHPEDEDDDRQPQRHLGHGDRDGERGKDHPDHVGVEAREGDQVDVDGVEHQLDAEQDADGVPPRDDTEEADGEEHRGEGQVRAEAHGYSSGLAKYNAPRSPTSSSTARSSNGRTNSVSSTWPMARVTSTAMTGRSTGRSAPLRAPRTPRSRAPASTRPVTMCRLPWLEGAAPAPPAPGGGGPPPAPGPSRCAGSSA